MEQLNRTIHGRDFVSYCKCEPGVGGHNCNIDIKNECELDPCGNRTGVSAGAALVGDQSSTSVGGYKCVDRKGHFECVPETGKRPHGTTASTTRAPFVDRKEGDQEAGSSRIFTV